MAVQDMRLGRYRKAIVALMSGVVGVAALFIPNVADFMPPETIAAISTVVATVLVYAIPNDPT